MVAALYMAALKNWTPENSDKVDEMISVLCESPTSKALGTTVYGNPGSQFMTNAMKQNEKYKYIGNSYFNGATVENNYEPSAPLTVTVCDYVYDGVWSDDYNSYIYTVVVKSAGADTERLLKVYQDPFDQEWYIFSDSYKGFVADIVEP